MLQGLRSESPRVTANVLAGITLAALSIPEVMGYTRISGTPVATGLYTMLIPMVLYAFFGSSRHLVVAADSATAAILAAGIAGMAVPQSKEWLAMAGILALMSAAFLFLARLARLGFLANFLSRTVLIGFLSGVGVQVALGALPGMLGLPGGGHAGAFDHLRRMVNEIGQASMPALACSIGVLALIVGLRRVSGKIPGAMIAVTGGIVAVWAFHLQSHGVAVIGAIPTGLPRLGVPQIAVSASLLERLAPTAFAMFVVILAQSAATSRAYAERSNESFSENVDLVGLALANIGAGLSGTFVVNGSPTKTQIVAGAGGTSQLAQITSCIIVLAVLLFLTGPLSFLPTAVLSAVVFLIGVELINFSGMKMIYRERPYEFWVALVTAVAVVSVGIEQSILLALVLSLAVHTRHGYLVKNVVLVYGQKGWQQKQVETGQQAAPGLVIYRFLHNMYYANAHVLREDVLGVVERAQPALSWLCIDMAAVNDVDFTAAETLRALHGFLAAKGVRIVFCELVDATREGFRRSGLLDTFGPDAFFPTSAAVFETYGGASARIDSAGAVLTGTTAGAAPTPVPPLNG